MFSKEKKIAYWIVVITLAILSRSVHSLGQSSPRSLDSSQKLASLAGYERLAIGMNLTDAQSTLGRAIEVSRDETTITYKWVNSDGSQISAVFKGNRLVSKGQLGLKE